jgi:hypothetical protein
LHLAAQCGTEGSTTANSYVIIYISIDDFINKSAKLPESWWVCGAKWYEYINARDASRETVVTISALKRQLAEQWQLYVRSMSSYGRGWLPSPPDDQSEEGGL